jgi:hypothetical protein
LFPLISAFIVDRKGAKIPCKNGNNVIINSKQQKGIIPLFPKLIFPQDLYHSKQIAANQE